MILSLVINTDAHFWTIFYLPQNGWVWLGGCGFGLTTLKELAPGLPVAVFRYCSTEEYEVIKQELEIVFRIPVQFLEQESYMH